MGMVLGGWWGIGAGTGGVAGGITHRLISLWHSSLS